MKSLALLILFSLFAYSQETESQNQEVINNKKQLQELKSLQLQKNSAEILKKENLMKIYEISKRPNYIGNALNSQLSDIWRNSIISNNNLLKKKN